MFSGKPFADGLAAPKGAILVGVNVNSIDLGGRQQLFPAAFAQSANYALRSAGSFDVGESLTVASGATVAGGATVTGNVTATGDVTSSSGTVRADKLSGYTPTDAGVAGLVTTTGDAKINGNLAVGGATKPSYDSGWFQVTDTHADVKLYHHGPGPLYNFTILTCGQLSNSNNTGIPDFNTATPLNTSKCNYDVMIQGETGHMDRYNFANPGVVTYGADGNNWYLMLHMLPGNWIWGAVSGNSWTCPLPGNNACYTGYMRVIGWY
jgi:hypothetical protein